MNFNDFIGPQTGQFANCAPEISKIYYKLYREHLIPPPVDFCLIITPSPWISKVFSSSLPLDFCIFNSTSLDFPRSSLPPPYVQKINAICQCLCVSLIRTVLFYWQVMVPLKYLAEIPNLDQPTDKQH